MLVSENDIFPDYQCKRSTLETMEEKLRAIAKLTHEYLLRIIENDLKQLVVSNGCRQQLLLRDHRLNAQRFRDDSCIEYHNP